MRKTIVVYLILIVVFNRIAYGDNIVTSPDGLYKVFLYIEKGSHNKTRLSYEVQYKNLPVIEKSELEIKLDNSLSEMAMALKPDEDFRFLNDMDFISRRDTTADNTWQNLFGERSQVRDHYNQSSFVFEKRNKKGYIMQVDIRAYNQGVAIRYYFPTNPKGIYYKVIEENTEFVLPKGTKAWYHRHAQAPYQLLPIEGWAGESERPLTCVLPSTLFVVLAEARMIDYARTKFKVKGGFSGTLVTSLDGAVDAITDFSTPWRVIMAAEKPGQLLENNDLLLNLNDPCALPNIIWIKPGKIMREIAQTDTNSKEQIDFSAENGIDYLLYDWKWYGPAFDFKSDASTVDIDLDLHRWIKYGKERGVGIWVYVNQQALLKQMREIFPLYKKWGITGVKFGFVQTGSYRWTTWLHEAVKLAAENELMVNIHDEFRTTGETRTFPNIVSAEGIRGNEEFPDATHNTILPFTRFVGGLGDYTICYMDKRLKTTHAHQLALGVVYFSPLQTIYWYDKVSAFKDVPEIEFFSSLPTVWDETRVLDGEIGGFAAIARRKEKVWYIGAITNNEAREVSIPLSFLDKTKKYSATLYSDDPSLETKTNVKIEKVKLDLKRGIKMKLLPSGGAALRIEEI